MTVYCPCAYDCHSQPNPCSFGCVVHHQEVTGEPESQTGECVRGSIPNYCWTHNSFWWSLKERCESA